MINWKKCISCHGLLLKVLSQNFHARTDRYHEETQYSMPLALELNLGSHTYKSRISSHLAVMFSVLTHSLTALWI